MYDNTAYCHTSIDSCKCMGVNGKPCSCAVYKKWYFYYHVQVRLESISVQQVKREPILGTTSHVRCVWTSIKLKVRMMKSLSPYCRAMPEEIILLSCCHWCSYSCCVFVMIQRAANLWYSFVHLYIVTQLAAYHLTSFAAAYYLTLQLPFHLQVHLM